MNDHENVMELDGYPGPFMKIPYKSEDGNIHVLLIRYRVLCAACKNKEHLIKVMESELDTIRSDLQTVYNWSVIWWRNRPECTFDKEKNRWVWYARLATSPELHHVLLNGLHFKAEGSEPALIKEEEQQ